MAAQSVEDAIIALIGSGQARTRADIVKRTGLAASTISAAVSRLVDSGAINETEESVSTGGRRARMLAPADAGGVRALIELGAHRALLALTDPDTGITEPTSTPINVADGPRRVLTALRDAITGQEEAHGRTATRIAVAVPGPVDAPRSRVIRPARMPGWDGVDFAALIRQETGMTASIENDARAGAMGELVYRRREGAGADGANPLIYVKAGSAIGGALLIDGSPVEGADGLAGDISHIPVPAAASRPCKCGNVGCLETIASADAIRADLAASGVSFDSNASLLNAARDGIPEVATAIRSAGILLGESLAHIVSFLNPRAVIIGGALSAVDAHVAGVRQALHQSCLPSIMDSLVIESSRTGRAAALWGLTTSTPTLPKENRP